MEQGLYNAAVAGDVTSLDHLIKEDSRLLDKASLICQDKNPLHIAAMFGHVDFVKKILQNNSNMCLASDRFGRNPLHLAAIEGKLEVLKELICIRPQAAREKTAGGDTVLHLCIKYNQLEALKYLVETIKDHELVNVKNGEGMTVLHLAICNGQNQTIEYLLQNKNVDVNALNANGNTALDLFQEESKSKFAPYLKAEGAKEGKKIATQKIEWLNKKGESLMIVASLIATMAFQAGVSPPGGVWQDDKFLHDTKLSTDTKSSHDTKPHTAGKVVMAYNDEYAKYYRYFVRANTAAFVSSLSIMLLLIGDLPFQRNQFFTWALTVIMWMTVTSAAITYWVSIILVTPAENPSSIFLTMIGVTVWSGVLALLLLGNTFRLLDRWFGKDLSSKIKRWYWKVPEKTNDNQEHNQVSSV